MRDLGFALLLFASTAGIALAAEPEAESKGLLPVPDYSGDLWNRSHLAGDWGGTRAELAHRGIQLDVDYTQYMQSVVDGGVDTGTRYGGHLDYLMHFDLMRMGAVPGGLVTVRAESRYGQSVNGIAGPILPVNTMALFPLTDNLDEGVPVFVTDLNYTQFLSEHLAVFAGKLDTLDADPNEFASGRGKSQFMDANFLFNGALALRLPYSTLGAGVKWFPSPQFSLAASIVNTADSSSTSGFNDLNDGQSVTIEADIQYRLGQLPGGMNIGGLYSYDQNFNKIGGKLVFQPGQVLTPPSSDHTWAMYWSGWQYLVVLDPTDKPIVAGDGRPDHRGFGLFARAGIADQDTNPIEWSGSIGIGGRGVIPSRDNDTFGVGYYYTNFQETRIGGALGISDKAQGFEAFYNIALTPATNLTFDLQLDESQLPNTDTAVIMGMRLNMSF